MHPVLVRALVLLGVFVAANAFYVWSLDAW